MRNLEIVTKCTASDNLKCDTEFVFCRENA